MSPKSCYIRPALHPGARRCSSVAYARYVHNLATDAKGNLYTTETYNGARVQRFVFKGERPITTTGQCVPWPRR